MGAAPGAGGNAEPFAEETGQVDLGREAAFGGDAAQGKPACMTIAEYLRLADSIDFDGEVVDYAPDGRIVLLPARADRP